MKILHTGDIHLGSSLDNHPRNQELSRVFQFLIQKVHDEKIGAALLAGDIFDRTSPSIESKKLYFDFLCGLKQAGCREIIVIAGNHDSPADLEAADGLLLPMGIHLIGNADPDNPAREVIPLDDPEKPGTPAALICAVPFLRDQDVRKFVPENENISDRNAAIAAGIAGHYHTVYRIADSMRAGRSIPIIGMGHLFAGGSTLSAKVSADKISGNLKIVDLKTMPEGFDYVALGHIHQPQTIPGFEKWHYAGSLLPMNIRDEMYAPEAVILDTEDPAHWQTFELPHSCFHKMRLVKGNMDELRNTLNELAADGTPCWVKPVYTGKELVPDWSLNLRQEMLGTCVELVFPEVRLDEQKKEEAVQEIRPLESMTPEELFTETLDSLKEIQSPEQKETLTGLFRETVQNMGENIPQKESGKEKTARGLLRFKSLCFKNINSLYGSHKINFEDPAFNSGIFLISGKTGAGKSSILDAISLALFGGTPRTEKITSTNDEVMSKGTGELLAELTFSLGDDVYRARFSHKRKPRKKEDFQVPEHTLFHQDRAVSEKAKDTAAVITALIGMDMNQFRRCILLAQGSFDSFLKSKDSERAEILQNITGTGRYEEISKAVSADFKTVKDRYDLLCKSLDGHKQLPEEERDLLKEKCKELSAAIQSLEEQFKQSEKTEEIFRQTDLQSKALAEAEAAHRKWTAESESAGPARQELADANRAQCCREALSVLQQSRLKAAALEKNISVLNNEIPCLKQSCDAAQKELAEAETLCAETGAKKTKLELLLKEVRALDVQIAEAEKAEKKARQELTRIRAGKDAHEREMNTQAEQWKTKEAAFAGASAYLAEHTADSALEQQKTLWEIRRAELVRKEQLYTRNTQDFNTKSHEKESLLKTLERQRKKCQEQASRSEKIALQIAGTEQQIRTVLAGKTIDELKQAWSNAVSLRNYYQSVMDYAAVRKELRPGEKCPLCGSEDHPYCRELPGNRPSESARMAEELAAELQSVEKLQKDLTGMHTAHAKAEAETQILQADCENRKTALEEKEKLLTELSAALQTESAELEKTVSALTAEIKKILGVEWNDYSALPPELDSRICRFQQAKSEAESFQTEKIRYEKYAESAGALLEQMKTNLQSAESALDENIRRTDGLQKEREAKFGRENTDLAEKEMNTEFQAVQTRRENARTTLAALREKLRHTQEELANRETMLEAERKETEAAESTFLKKTEESGLTGENDCLQKMRSPQFIQQLTDRLSALGMNLARAVSVLKEREKALAEWKAKLPPDTDRMKNQEAIKAAGTALALRKEELKTAETQLLLDEKERERRLELQKQLDDLRVLYSNREILHNHFGFVNDKSKFAMIAQGHTFRELLMFANQNLPSAFKKHFSLVNTTENPLEIQVVDHFRGDMLRSVRNLSGGESFEVSLALALGMSEMSAVSQHARLGNVLLDEGFGSLDEESLDNALDLLMDLRGSDRKLVGIISHVSRLQERIPTHIEIFSSGGTGTLSGAGINSIKE